MDLYRYSRLSDNIIKYLCDRELYFQSPLNFNDPFECDLTTVNLGSDEDFDRNYNLYIQLLDKRLDYVFRKLRFIDARTTDYASADTPKKDRFYFGEQSELYIKEHNALISEIKLLNGCAISKRKGTLEEAWNRKKERVVNGLGVVCYSENDSSLLMWSHYAESHKGICLIYESEERPIIGWKQYKFHKVQYREDRHIDVLSCGFEDSFFNLLTTKSPDWEYEKEHRLITIKGAGSQKSRMASIQGIILGSRIKENPSTSLLALHAALKEIHNKRAGVPRFKYYYATKNPNQFRIEITKLRGIQDVPEVLGIED